MRFLIPLAVVVLSACSHPQPGCTPENCRLMVNDCRVEFQGGPQDISECLGIDPPKTPVDFSSYCVDSCNAGPAGGKLASCIASKASACLAATSAGMTTEQVIQPCIDADPPAKLPDPTCDTKCAMTRRTCDDACSGGKTCDACLRAGKDCRTLCADAGYKVCLDCSARCGLQYLNCSNSCPRVP